MCLLNVETLLSADCSSLPGTDATDSYSCMLHMLLFDCNPASGRAVSPRCRQARGKPAALPCSSVDKKLCVDLRTDTVRARVAAGLFERISEWNGFGRILLTATAGVDARPETPPGTAEPEHHL